ncbi:MAG: hypothetical protein JST80_11425 [Bdellovibrionales bacterium]|nr:hypothetical protein [Bdellovibrionales bacterium]
MIRPLVGLFLLFSAPTFATCDVYDLQRTLGTEWEFQPLYAKLYRSGLDLGFGESEMGLINELGNSKFKKLFDFYGKDETGHWVRGFVPSRIGNTEEFLNLVTRYPANFHAKNGGWQISGMDSMDNETFSKFLKDVMEARGNPNPDLKVRKIASAWNSLADPNPYDAMISEEAAEEWRAGKFNLFEFPMSGSVSKGSGVLGYMENLWVRLGFFKKGDPKLTIAVKKAVGHVHWVPNIKGMVETVREKVYASTIGYWGEYNDSAIVSRMSIFGQVKSLSGVQTLNDAMIQKAYAYLQEKVFGNITFSVLTRESFERISVTPNGILVKNRASDLRTIADANIPTVFRRLHLALRGSYGQETLPDDVPIPMIGLEARGEQNVVDGMNSLPRKISGTDKVDVESLAKYNTGEPAGLIGKTENLKIRAKALGINPRVIDTFDSILDAKQGLLWSKDQIRALAFLPMTDWETHPLFERNLSMVTPGEKERRLGTFQQALYRYTRRVNGLLNRNLSNEAFEMQVEVEMLRFVSESDLERLLKWHN